MDDAESEKFPLLTRNFLSASRARAIQDLTAPISA